MKTGRQTLNRSELHMHGCLDCKGVARLRVYLILCLFQLVSATNLNKGLCQTVGFRIQIFVTISLGAENPKIDYDCSGFCNDELKNLRDKVLFNDIAGTVMLSIPPTASSFRGQKVYLDHCTLYKRYCVQFWRALAIPQPITAAAAVDLDVEAKRASTERRMTHDPTDAAGLREKDFWADKSLKKVDCICDALYVLPRVRKTVPLWYPDQEFICEHEAICHRLTDLQLLRIGNVHWKCIDSAPLIETEHCYPTINTTPSACPCAYDHLMKLRSAGRSPRLTACEDWKSNPKAVELLSKAPLTASQWKTFRNTGSTNARDTNTITSQTPPERASTSRNPSSVRRPWLLNTRSTPQDKAPGLYSIAGPMTLSIDSLQRAKLAKKPQEPGDFARASPISHLGKASPSRATDSRREVSLHFAGFSEPICQAQNDQPSDPVVHPQPGSIFWQNSNHQPVGPASSLNPFDQFSETTLQQETESLDVIESRAALFETGVQSFSSFVKEVTERLPAAVQDQTQTRPPILSAAGSGSKRKADQIILDQSSHSLLDVGSLQLSYAARFGIDAETIAAATQCPVTPAGQIEVVHPASTIDLEVLPASDVDISSLGSLNDQMLEFIHANDESVTANQAPEADQALIEPPDEWAWRFL